VMREVWRAGKSLRCVDVVVEGCVGRRLLRRGCVLWRFVCACHRFCA